MQMGAEPVVVLAVQCAEPVVVLAVQCVEPVVVLAVRCAEPVVALAVRCAEPVVALAVQCVEPVVFLVALPEFQKFYVESQRPGEWHLDFLDGPHSQGDPRVDRLFDLLWSLHEFLSEFVFHEFRPLRFVFECIRAILHEQKRPSFLDL